MIATHPLLKELDRCGAAAYRVGDRLRIIRADRVPADLLDRLRARKAEIMPIVPEDAPTIPSAAPSEALLVASRVLGESVWLVEDEDHRAALEPELAAEGDGRLVFSVPELLVLREMLAADQDTALRVLGIVKATFGAAVLSNVARPDEKPQ